LHDFLALLGHELRSPLGAIRNALCVLEQQGDDTSKREWARRMMERQMECIGRLLEEMLELSCIEHGKIQLHKESLDLAQTVSQAVETVRSSLEERGHRLVVALPPKPVTLNADSRKVEQMVTNLLNNASKYMEPDGTIWVTAEVEGEDVVLRVRDSGIGIDSEMLPHIFDPFWQVKRTLDHSHGGLGIGLALVRKLAELHGGSVQAHSAGLGLGSEFVVRLPAHAGVFVDACYRSQEHDTGVSMT